jgi:hypothetical protein
MILSCFGKLFTSILNQRINIFLELNNLLGQEQAGFRKGYFTMDHVFTLHCIIELYLQQKKKIYCTFVDYRKAFDSIQRAILWGKLWQTGVNGKILNVIKDMYSKAKSCVKTLQGVSKFFLSNVGVRQGENLSPVLFSIFLNDLKSVLGQTVNGLNLPLAFCCDFNLTDVENCVHLFLLLYADDTVVLSETVEDMQKSLDAMAIFCDNFGLKINTEKTKVIVFFKR